MSVSNLVHRERSMRGLKISSKSLKGHASAACRNAVSISLQLVIPASCFVRAHTTAINLCTRTYGRSKYWKQTHQHKPCKTLISSRKLKHTAIVNVAGGPLWTDIAQKWKSRLPIRGQCWGEVAAGKSQQCLARWSRAARQLQSSGWQMPIILGWKIEPHWNERCNE